VWISTGAPPRRGTTSLSSYGDDRMLSPYAYTHNRHRTLTEVRGKRSPTMPSTPITSIHDLAAAVRGRRLSLGLSQAEVARRAHVSRPWISEFESGKASAELGLVLRLVDALELRLDLADREGASGVDQLPRSGTVDLDALLDDYRSR
jgi:HTH-type transcriptional regulator / antitoxin HipB